MVNLLRFEASDAVLPAGPLDDMDADLPTVAPEIVLLAEEAAGSTDPCSFAGEDMAAGFTDWFGMTADVSGQMGWPSS